MTAAIHDGRVRGASFSNGDPPLSMASLKDGRWSGTWQRGVRESPGWWSVECLHYRRISARAAQVSGSLRPTPILPCVPGGVISSVGPPDRRGRSGSLISILDRGLPRRKVPVHAAPADQLGRLVPVWRTLLRWRRTRRPDQCTNSVRHSVMPAIVDRGKGPRRARRRRS